MEKSNNEMRNGHASRMLITWLNWRKEATQAWYIQIHERASHLSEAITTTGWTRHDLPTCCFLGLNRFRLMLSSSSWFRAACWAAASNLLRCSFSWSATYVEKIFLKKLINFHQVLYYQLVNLREKITLKDRVNLTNNEKKVFASVILGDSPKYSTHSLNASWATLVSARNRFNLSSLLPRKSFSILRFWLPDLSFVFISHSFLTMSIFFSKSLTSV